MPPSIESPFGLVAGNGIFPIDVARALHEKGIKIIAVAHKGETDPKLKDFCQVFEWVKIGQLGKVIEILKKHSVKQVALAGGIRRVPLLGGIALDAKGLGLITRLKSLRDDALLRGVAAELESAGIKVISASSLLPKSNLKCGILAGPPLSADQLRDAKVALDVIKGLGVLDIGQTIVVHQGTVIAVEAIEGTNETLKRAALLLKGTGGLVAKFSKATQDERLDLPAVGPGTMHLMHKLKLRALLIEADRSIVLEPENTCALAAKYGITFANIRDVKDL